MFLVTALLLVACKGGPDDTALPEASGCDPVDPSLCALPFPSSAFLAEADTETGYRVAFGPTSLPENRDGVQMKPDYVNELDGFSTNSAALTWFEDVSLDGVVGHDDIGAYLADDAKTVIVNAETGERVPHFVELDMSGEDPAERLLMLRPVQPLDHATRYVVGIRGLERNAGGPVDVAPAFAALRDGTESSDPDVALRRQHYEDVVFPALEGAGFPRAELQRAWDYVTVSRQKSLGRAEHMRDDMLARLPASGPTYELTKVEDHDCETESIGRTLKGEITVPYYTETDTAGTLLTRGDDGLPYYVGDTTSEFMVRIPCSLLEEPEPAMVVQYGHGLLGDKSEAYTGWLGRFQDERKFIVFAMDWKGMSTWDAPAITLMLVNDPSDFALLPERSLQGFVEKVAAVELIEKGLVEDENLAVDGVPLVDPEQITYYGISQGGILGGSYVAMSPKIQRAVFGVGGGPYEMLLNRSADFEPFFLIFQEKFTDHRDIRLMISLMQTLWDPAESAGWLRELREKDVLLQVAIGDAQVTTLGAHFQARGIGAKLVEPATRDVWGLEEAAPPLQGSALVEWEYTDGPDEPYTNTPPDADLDTHECVRREPAGQEQVWTFLTTGSIDHFCDGPCVSERAGLCD